LVRRRKLRARRRKRWLDHVARVLADRRFNPKQEQQSYPQDSMFAIHYSGKEAIVTALQHDIRYAFRTLRRTPAFTTVAVLSLALGIGANTAIFSLVDTILLRTLPVRDPKQLVELLRRFPGEPTLNSFGWNLYEFLRDHNNSFSSVIAIGSHSLSVRSGNQPNEHVSAGYVTGDFFPVLGMTAAHGRLIGPADGNEAAPSAAAVISYAWWKSRYNLDPHVFGKQLFIEDAPFAIIGVAPPDFAGLQPGYRQEIWIPVAIEPQLRPAAARAHLRHDSVSLVARLKPGVTIGQARTEVAVLNRRSFETKVETNRFASVMTMEVESAGAGLSLLRQQFGQPVMIVMAVVGLLLLIACTNVASMLLARGAARQREISVRIALGATRVHLLRQALTESLLLSAAGTLLGAAVAYLGTALLVRIMESGRQFGPRVQLEVRPDANVLAFAAAAAIVTGLLFGLAPALQAFASAPANTIREASKAGDTRFRRLIGKCLVAAQVALSLVLLSSATLFVQHLANGYANLGFQRDHVLLISLDPSRSGLNRDQLAPAYRELLDRLGAIPGVRIATLAGTTPVSGAGANRDASVEGYTPKPGELRDMPLNWVAPRYFETLGTPLLAGRDFTYHDAGGQRAIIVNLTMSRHYFGNASPIGKHVLFDGDDKPYEIIGLVGDTKYLEMRETTNSIVYFNAFQSARMTSHQIALRTTVDPDSVAPEVRRTVSALLKNVSISRITTLSDQVDASIVPERLIVTLSTLFGALGGLLAAIGLYGLLAYTVARRVHEIAIRMALGATQSRVLTMIFRDAFGMVVAGLVVGAPLTLWAKRIAAALVPWLPANPVVPIALGTLAMLVIALIAALAPAHRASRVDPMEALRY
jgi:predicted permease